LVAREQDCAALFGVCADHEVREDTPWPCITPLGAVTFGVVTLCYGGTSPYRLVDVPISPDLHRVKEMIDEFR
jgi:hypothetical protein